MITHGCNIRIAMHCIDTCTCIEHCFIDLHPCGGGEHQEFEPCEIGLPAKSKHMSDKPETLCVGLYHVSRSWGLQQTSCHPTPSKDLVQNWVVRGKKRLYPVKCVCVCVYIYIYIYIWVGGHVSLPCHSTAPLPGSFYCDLECTELSPQERRRYGQESRTPGLPF